MGRNVDGLLTVAIGNSVLRHRRNLLLVFTTPPFGQGRHLINHRDGQQKMNVLSAECQGHRLLVGRGIAGRPGRSTKFICSSPGHRNGPPMDPHQPLDRLVDGQEFPGTAVPVFFSLHGLAGNARDRLLVVLDIASSVAYPSTVGAFEGTGISMLCSTSLSTRSSTSSANMLEICGQVATRVLVVECSRILSQRQQ